MSREVAEETLEEGRVALYQLERQLKERGFNPSGDNRSEGSSKSGRRLLDQLPRIARLNNRAESLGLTVEELDDRGLLDGGASVPSYYTSMKQRNRRVLELQPRSHRLQERGKETISKNLNGVFHMLRTLTKRGLNLEEYLKKLDESRQGTLTKKQMIYILKQIGLPYSAKEISDVIQNYNSNGNDRIDYVQFLKDGHLLKKNHSSNITEFPPNYLRSFTITLQYVRKMILDSSKSLNKDPDDVYKMFVRWDNQSTGTITATQFLRELSRLHIELSEQDQDFLVELLDVNAMGRIDFENLLSFCFGYSDQDLMSPHSIVGSAIGFDAENGETLSAVSIDGNTSIELKSNYSGNALKRPHTASLSRPYTSSKGNPFESEMKNQRISNISYDLIQENNKPNIRNRPMTATARVSSTMNNPTQNSHQHARGNNYRNDDHMILNDLPDDVINDDEMFDKNHNNAYNYSNNSTENYREETQNNVEDIPQGIESSKYGHEDHLVLLANQTLSALRDIILTRYRRGRSLHEIFQHFDRQGKGFFDANDFIQATFDLRIEISEKVALIAIQHMALDGVNQVSFGEFKVYVLDSDHHLLELNVQTQCSQILEQQGKDYQNWMVDVFRNEEESLNDSRQDISPIEKISDLISKEAFISGLKKIGLTLTSSEISRLSDRFDIYGNEFCSVIRFIRMIQNSLPWKHAEKVLYFQEKAVEEAKILRAKQQNNQQSGLPQIPEELINMCEYLGIRVLSEPNMIWIASDALKAPLPVNWSAHKDADGKIYFHNKLTGQSKWEHPLDPHFRNLRDRYRQSATDENNDVNISLYPENNLTEHKINMLQRPQLEQFSGNTELLGKVKTSALKIPSENIKVIPNTTYIRPHSALDQKGMPDLGRFPDISKELPESPNEKNSSQNRPSSAPSHQINKYKPQSTFTPGPELVYRIPETPVPPNPNKPNLSHSQNKVIMEAVYSAPYLKRQSTDVNKIAENKIPPEEKLPRRVKSATTRSTTPLSVVDRLISVGKSSSGLGERSRSRNDVNINNYMLSSNKESDTRNLKLNEMLEGNIIEKIDQMLIMKR